MYHLMTGKLPFPGSSPIERLGKRIGGRHTPISDYLPDIPPSFVRVIDKLLAHKPHERYASAAEAAEALQGLLRPKARGSAAGQQRDQAVGALARSISLEPKAAPESNAQSVHAQASTIVKTRPSYPAWFAPAARFAERRPKSALASVIVSLLATFGAGIALGMILR
jgi:serine/threonine-protein kinase